MDDVSGVSSAPPLIRTVGGGGEGVASRTVPPTRSGTWRWSRSGLWGGLLSSGLDVVAFLNVWGNENSGSSLRAASGVSTGVLSLKLIVCPTLAGFAGNVEKGPSVTDRLLGGLPRNFPEVLLLLLGQAEETAGPCRRLDREVEGVIADRGSLSGT